MPDEDQWTRLAYLVIVGVISYWCMDFGAVIGNGRDMRACGATPHSASTTGGRCAAREDRRDVSGIIRGASLTSGIGACSTQGRGRLQNRLNGLRLRLRLPAASLQIAPREFLPPLHKPVLALAGLPFGLLAGRSHSG